MDRALATQAWINSFSQCKLTNIVAYKFDHSPIMLSLERNFGRRVCEVFHFENDWLQDEDLTRVVEKG